MQVTYQLTPNDYRHALIAYRNSKLFSKWATLFFLGLAILMTVAELVMLILMHDQWLWKPIALTGGYAVVGSFFYWKTPSMSANRQFRNTPSVQNPITLDVSDSGLHYRSVNTDATVSWNSYIKWMQDEMVFALFPTPKIFIVIPKRAFSAEQVKAFSEILQQKIKTQK